MLLLACTTMRAACRPTWHARNVLIFAGDRKQQEQTLHERRCTLALLRKQIYGQANKKKKTKRTLAPHTSVSCLTNLLEQFDR